MAKCNTNWGDEREAVKVWGGRHNWGLSKSSIGLDEDQTRGQANIFLFSWCKIFFLKSN